MNMINRQLALLTLLVLASSCATYKANFGPGAEERKTQIRVFVDSYDDVYRAVMQTAASQQWEITHSDKDAGLVQARTPKSLSAWDDEVSGGVQVQVKKRSGK